jgi:hypothetical protein
MAAATTLWMQDLDTTTKAIRATGTPVVTSWDAWRKLIKSNLAIAMGAMAAFKTADKDKLKGTAAATRAYNKKVLTGSLSANTKKGQTKGAQRKTAARKRAATRAKPKKAATPKKRTPRQRRSKSSKSKSNRSQKSKSKSSRSQESKSKSSKSQDHPESTSPSPSGSEEGELSLRANEEHGSRLSRLRKRGQKANLAEDESSAGNSAVSDEGSDWLPSAVHSAPAPSDTYYASVEEDEFKVGRVAAFPGASPGEIFIVLILSTDQAHSGVLRGQYLTPVAVGSNTGKYMYAKYDTGEDHTVNIVDARIRKRPKHSLAVHCMLAIVEWENGTESVKENWSADSVMTESEWDNLDALLDNEIGNDDEGDDYEGDDESESDNS